MINPKIDYRCPECGDRDHLYMRADIRWSFKRQEWIHVHGSEEDHDVDCTECDWTGFIAEAEAEAA
jgi:DNA-directed RNA polymerase subunit RPC12/RpoP